jgi:hypothetical protein
LPGGRTTTYAYIPATGSAADYALEAVTFPDGSLVSYAYDGLALKQAHWKIVMGRMRLAD